MALQYKGVALIQIRKRLWDSVIVRNVDGSTHNASLIITSGTGARLTAYYPNNQKPEFTLLTLHFVYFTSTNFP